MKARTAITPTRAENFAEWYQQVIRAADLAETSSVRGCMVIKPWGYGIWELIQGILDRMIKASGHKNAYFPLFIPLSFFEREAAHVEGFAKECAVITHSRLVQGENGTLHPASPLAEPLIVRPTSETIIGESFARWIQSHRDLPLLINQWANVVRWEMRPRMFLRTTEFLWQEGHTAHATAEEAREETERMLEIYRSLAEEFLAIPVTCGEKSQGERFPGAEMTLTIEALMQDGKALQMGTSHFLGQNFARSCNIQFTAANGSRMYPWTTSWGVSTRLIGGVIMTHGDDDGLVLPPAIAPVQIIILPIFHDGEDVDRILEAADRLCGELRNTIWRNAPLRVEVDKREMRGGEKYWEYAKKGVPIRLEIGARDIASDRVTFTRRDMKERHQMAPDAFIGSIGELLNDIHGELFLRAYRRQVEQTVTATTFDEFHAHFAAGGGFVRTYFCGDGAIEERIRENLGVTSRCFPIGGKAIPIPALSTLHILGVRCFGQGHTSCGLKITRHPMTAGVCPTGNGIPYHYSAAFQN
jgi:prolyl-tRNA synthetase